MRTVKEKIWKIPVSWEMCGMVKINAPTLDEAMDIARDRDEVIPIPEDSTYVDGSWDLSCDDLDVIRKAYNKNQADSKVSEKGINS